MKTKIRAALSALLVATCAAPSGVRAAIPAPAVPAPGYHVVRRLPMTDGWWDYASFDPVHRRLFVTRGRGTMMMDVESGRIDPRIIPGSEGRATVLTPDGDTALSVMAGWGAAILFNPNDGSIRGTASFVQVPDAAAFDPATQLFWVMGTHGDTTLVSPKDGKIEGTVTIGGELEFPAADGQGRLFVNVTDRGAIAAIDTRKRAVVARYAMHGCDEPTGLAYIPGDALLVSACSNGHAKVLRAVDGSEVADIAIGRDPDAVIYDPPRHLVFIPSGGDGTLSVLSVDSPGRVRLLERDPTQAGTRTGAVDPKTGLLYLPTARFGPKNKLGFTEALPGTVQLLVMAPDRPVAP